MKTSPLSAGMRPWVPIALFAMLWIDVFRQLSYTWETNEQYAFGWFVPFLALGLLFRRWETSPRSEGDPRGEPPARRFLPWGAFAVALALLHLPLRLVHEINQDWPLLSWILALNAVTLSLFALHHGGGPVALRQYGFPVLFTLTAVQWPYRIENSLIHTLMPTIAALTVEILDWMGIVALQRGNIIELARGVLGVDEACSGIRSFQSTLTGALFLGEVYRLTIPFRIVLVGAGLSCAFLLNLSRTLFLSWQAETNGISAVDQWHDSAGLVLAFASFAVLWAITYALRHKTAFVAPSVPAHPSPPEAARPFKLPASLSKFLIFAGCWAALSVAATEMWYRSKRAAIASTAPWWISYPTNAPAFAPVPVSDTASKLLRFDHASTGSWIEPDGSQWSLFCFRWDAGDPTSRMSAQAHRPEYCLVGSGHQMTSMSEIRHLELPNVSLAYRMYSFSQDQRKLHVFFALWEEGALHQEGFGRTKTGDRIRSAFQGRRGLGQQTLEIICSGYTDLQSAEAAIRARLTSMISPGRPPVDPSTAQGPASPYQAVQP